MCRLLLVSHGDLSSAMVSTASMILGEQSHVYSLTLPYGKDLDEYEKEIEEHVVSAKGEGILILADLFGGSPFMISTRVFAKYHQEIEMDIVTGMNLGMILQVVSMKENATCTELKNIAMEAGTQSIIDFRSKI